MFPVVGNKPTRSAATATQNSTCSTTPNCMPPSTAGNLRKLRPQRQQHLKQHPKQYLKTAASAPKLHAAIDLARMRPHHHQHLKQHPKLSAPPLSNSTGTSTLISSANCMPPSTRPSVSQSGTSTSTRNCMPLVPGRQSRKTHLHQPSKLHAPYLAKRHLHQYPKLHDP